MFNDKDFEFIDTDEVKHGGRLARFTTQAGIPYSAIYVGDFEYANHERTKEKDMIKWFNENYTK